MVKLNTPRLFWALFALSTLGLSCGDSKTTNELEESTVTKDGVVKNAGKKGDE